MPDTLTIERLVAAGPSRQLYRARRGRADWALALLPRAQGSPAGWAARLEAVPASAAKVRAAGAAPVEEVGAVQGTAAALRPWLAGHPARVLSRTKTEGLPPLLVLLATVDLATALERLHGAGLCHGDASAESAWVGPEGRLSLVDAGLVPALSGRPGSVAADIQSLGRTLYLWLTGREANLDSREPVPPEFGLPSRLDRRVPALADALVLRALQAGGPRGLKSAGEMVASLRQVLRSAGAAVSPSDVASWVDKRAGTGAIDIDAVPLLATGKSVELGALSDRRPAARVADTVVDFEVPRRAPHREAPAPRAETVTDVSASSISMPPITMTSLEMTGSSLSRSVSVMQRPRRRRAFSALAAAALLGGVVVVGYALGDRLGGHRDGAHSPAPAPAPPVVARPEPASAPGKPPPGPPPPLPVLPPDDAQAAARPKPPPRKVAHEHAEPHLGHGAFLSLEANRVARIFVDGHDTRLLTPVTRVPISPGSHHIRLVAALGAEGTQEFEIRVRRGATAYRYGDLGE